MTKGKPNNWRDKEFGRLKRVRDADWYWWVDKKPRKRKRKSMSRQSEFKEWVEGTFYFEGGDWPDPKLIAAHLLGVCEAYVNKGIGSGDFGAKDMVVTMHHQGDSATARMLYDYLKQYIEGKQ